MKIKSALCLLFVLTTSLTQAQKINIDFCNSIADIDSRKHCIKSTFDNLIVKELKNTKDQLNFSKKDSLSLRFSLDISRVGVVTMSDFETDDQSLYVALNNLTNQIKPLGIYRNNRKTIVGTTIDYNLTLIKQADDAILIEEDNKTIMVLKKKCPEDNASAKPGKKTKVPVEEKQQKEHTKDTTTKSAPFAIIEQVPVFPGCEQEIDNNSQRNCMSNFINDFVVNNFNTSLVNTLKLPTGTVRISVQFRISTFGFIENVIARAPHQVLEGEAIRVVSSLPRMIPGRQRGENVNVLYSLPILFKVEGDEAPQEKAQQEVIENPIYPGCKSDDNDFRSQCMREKIDVFIKNNFDVSIADELDIPKGIVQIDVSFRVDENGNVNEITAKGVHELLEQEAVSTIKKLPKIKPGKKNGKAVGFLYTLPIIFEIN